MTETVLSGVTAERIDGPSGHLYRDLGAGDSGGRGLWVPGVTTIIDDVLATPPRLADWQQRQDIAAGVDSADADDPVEAGLALARGRRQAAMDDGTRAHAAIEEFLDGRIDAGQVLDDCQRAAAEAVAALGIESFACEVPGVRYGRAGMSYGGTVDMVAMDGDGRCVVVDWKTSASEWPAEAWWREEVQVAAYSGLPVSAAGVQRAAVVRIAAAGRLRITEIDLADRWDDWCLVLALHARMRRPESPRRRVRLLTAER